MKDILDLNGWKLTGTRIDKGEAKDMLVFEAEYQHDPRGCTKCGCVSFYRHGVKKVKFTDSPMRGMHASIEASARRYKCRDKDCGATFMQPLGGVLESPRMTERCVKFIKDICLKHSFIHVAKEIGVDEKTVRSIGRAKAITVVEAHRPRLPRVLGIDETRIAKKLRVVFTDIEDRKLLDMKDDRKQGVVEQWFSQFHDRSSVEVITMDMWRPYQRLSRKYFPRAVIVVDKFHILRMASEAMDRVRIRLARTRPAEVGTSWKRSRHVLHKPYDKLTPSQKFNRDTWLDNEPEIRYALEAKDAFYGIYKLPKEEAAKAFDAYPDSLHPSIRKEFRRLVTAMRNWRTEILAFFDAPYTNAYTESLNNLIKRIVKDGRGYSYDVLRARILAQYGDKPKAQLRIKYLIKDHNNPCDNCGCLCSAADMTPVVLPPLLKGQKSKEALVCPGCAERFHT